MSTTLSNLPIALPDGVQLTKESEEELLNKEWCVSVASDQCTHFKAALQTTDESTDESVVALGNELSTAIIVTDVGRFFFGADTSTIKGWFEEKKSKSLMEDGEAYFYPSLFSSEVAWEKFLGSDRNKSTEYIIVPVMTLAGEEGSDRERELQEVYSRNISTILHEVAARARNDRGQDNGSRAPPEIPFPKLKVLMFPIKQEMTVIVNPGTELPETIDTDTTYLGVPEHVERALYQVQERLAQDIRRGPCQWVPVNDTHESCTARD